MKLPAAVWYLNSFFVLFPACSGKFTLISHPGEAVLEAGLNALFQLFLQLFENKYLFASRAKLLTKTCDNELEPSNGFIYKTNRL